MGPASVIILAYGDEPWLQQCIQAVLDSRDVEVEIILVNNGSDSVKDVSPHAKVRILTPGVNTGFAGGCNLAASVATHETLVFVNSDLIVSANAIAALIERLGDDSIGLATGAVLLPDDDPRINSIGNPIHYLMFSWAGSFGEPFAGHQLAEDVAGVSGAFFACRREHWRLLGGFDDEFFAYAEDADISLRTWQSGHRVVFEPTAIGVHYYEFSKNTGKWFLLERNRLINVFTLYEIRSLILLLPILLPVEFGILLSAIRGDWVSEKWASWCWLLTHRDYLRQRHKKVNRAKSQREPSWSHVLVGRMDIPSEFGLRVPRTVNWVLDLYWNAIKNHIR